MPSHKSSRASTDENLLRSQGTLRCALPRLEHGPLRLRLLLLLLQPQQKIAHHLGVRARPETRPAPPNVLLRAHKLLERRPAAPPLRPKQRSP